jgi:glucosylceramidase
VTDGSTTNGNLPQLWTCTGGPNQSWTAGTDTTIRGLGKCLDVANNATTDGAAVHLWDCNNAVTTQKWTATGGALINTASGKCLDVKDNNTANGAKLQLWSCTGAANQKWNVPA